MVGLSCMTEHVGWRRALARLFKRRHVPLSRDLPVSRAYDWSCHPYSSLTDIICLVMRHAGNEEYNTVIRRLRLAEAASFDSARACSLTCGRLMAFRRSPRFRFSLDPVQWIQSDQPLDMLRPLHLQCFLPCCSSYLK